MDVRIGCVRDIGLVYFIYISLGKFMLGWVRL